MLLKKIIPLCVFLSLPHMTWASNYFAGGYGVQTFQSKTLDKYDVKSPGTIYGGYFGFRQQTLGLEGFYYKSNSNGDVNHNSSDYSLNTKDTIFGAALRFHLNFLSFKFGYALHRLNQSFTKDDTSVAADASMKRIYGVSDETRKSDGLVLGVGIRLPFSKTFSIYSDFTHYKLSNLEASIIVVEGGMRFDIPDLFPMIDK